MAEALGPSLPRIKIALLAYDIQVPGDLILALECVGIQTVAFSERPSTAFIVTQPLSVATLLTASQFFSDAVKQSPTKAVGSTRAVGMWRTDLIVEERSKAPSGYLQSALEQGMPIVAVLPFHYNGTINHPGSPFTTALSPTRHFLLEMIELARERPDLLLVVRGKNSRWVHEAEFDDLSRLVAETSNIMVDDDYATTNGSYRLIAHANLVIAKYTSLVDEALSVGIPCVIHDYTANAGAVAEPLVPYLPDGVWARRPAELTDRVEFALRNEGADFQKWWAPINSRLYGGLSDGHVRNRARELILRELQ